MCSSFRFSSAFSFCNASTDWVSGRMSSATSAAVYVIFLSAAAMNSPPKSNFNLPLLYHKGRLKYRNICNFQNIFVRIDPSVFLCG